MGGGETVGGGGFGGDGMCWILSQACLPAFSLQTYTSKIAGTGPRLLIVGWEG